jgi:hypothetical protein
MVSKIKTQDSFMEVVVLVPRIEGVLDCGRTPVLQANPSACSRWAGTREGVHRPSLQVVMVRATELARQPRPRGRLGDASP